MEQQLVSRRDLRGRSMRAAAPEPPVIISQPSRRLVLLGGDVRLREAVAAVAAAADLELSMQGDAREAIAVLAAPESLGAVVARPPGVPLIVVGEIAQPELWEVGMRAGADHVAPLPEAAPWLAAFLSRARSKPERARVISVLGGCGGAGGTTLALLLAQSFAAASARTLALDADSLGPGLEFLLGPMEGSALTWYELPSDGRPLDPARFLEALPEAGGCRVLGFGGQPADPPGFLAEAVLEASAQAFEIVIADLGRGDHPEARDDRQKATGDALASRLLSCSDLVLCLVPATVTGMLSARRTIARLESACSHVIRLVARGPFPEGVDPELMAEVLGLPLLGSLPRFRGLASADADRLSGALRHRALRRLHRSVLSELESKNQ